MKIKFLTLLIIISSIGSAWCQEKFTISGQVKDGNTGEDLISATIYVDELQSGAITNTYGFYSLTLEPGTYTFRYNYLGYNEIVKNIELDENKVVHVDLGTVSQVLEELVVTAEAENENVDEVGMSKVNMDISQVQKLPTLLGEVDIIKAIQLLPGVATVGEGTSGFYVRGGNVDQNLIMLDEAPVYNSSHLLGFFSVFNPDAVKDIQFYKGAIPAEYGGRLSSVVDIRMKDGNSKKFSGTAGIGMISSRLTLESPIGNNGSFILSGRRTYADLFLAFSQDSTVRNSILNFHDLNGKVNFKLGKNDRIYFNVYSGRDRFGEKDGFETSYGNETATFRWNHLFNQKLFSNLTLYVSDYDYLLGDNEETFAFEWVSQLQDFGVKYDMGAYINPRSTLKFGAQSILHQIDPGRLTGKGEKSIFNELILEDSKSLENALYIAHEYDFTPKLRLSYGVRASSFHNVGPRTVYNYDNNFQQIDSTVYTGNKFYQSYYNLEPRAGLRYTLNPESSFKASYNRTAQYIHLASNSTSASPLDVWFLSSPNVKPQLADQFTVGYFRNFDDNTWEASLEVYYKKFKNSIDFRDHAELFLNEQLEGELRYGKARSYGAEFLLRKNKGKLTGWVAYTLSKAEKQIEEINRGQWYNAKYDRVHDISIVASYDVSDRFSLSATWVYQTGSAVTFPTGKYFDLGRVVPIYSDRNSERMPDYHRLDLSAKFPKKKLLFGKFEQSLLVSVYNAYARKNAYSIGFKESETEQKKTVAEKTYLFTIIPSITYNVKF